MLQSFYYAQEQRTVSYRNKDMFRDTMQLFICFIDICLGPFVKERIIDMVCIIKILFARNRTADICTVIAISRNNMCNSSMGLNHTDLLIRVPSGTKISQAIPARPQ